jgi:hypothetical protein
MRLLAGFGKRHVYLALGFGLVVQLAHSTYALLGKEDLHAVPMLAWAVLFFFLALIGLGCAVAVDNLLGDSAPTGTRLVLAMVAAAVVTTLAVELLLYLLPQGVILAIEGQEKAPFVNDFHRIAFRFTTSAGWSLMLVALYTMLQASRRASERLHQMQLVALAAERAWLEDDLRAMQARVDPDLLFDTLLAVDRAYAKGMGSGEEALDALIGFLRAALPAEASATSSVAKELEHVRAYLAVTELLSASKPDLEMRAEPAAREAPMPAMLMLPLVRWALDGRPANRLQVLARRREAALVISVESDLGESSVSAGSDLAGVRNRLTHLYQGRGRLDVAIDADKRRASMEIPL